MYYSVSFSYPRPGRYNNINYDNATDSDENKALNDANKIVESTLAILGINHRHYYSWPDGTLIKWIESDMELIPLREMLNRTFCNDTRINFIETSNPNLNPYKYSHKLGREFYSLHEYMTH